MILNLGGVFDDQCYFRFSRVMKLSIPMGGRGCIYCTWLGYIYLADGLIDNGLSFISCINFPKVQKFMVSLLWPNPPPTDRVFKMLLILGSLRSHIK